MIVPSSGEDYIAIYAGSYCFFLICFLSSNALQIASSYLVFLFAAPTDSTVSMTLPPQKVDEEGPESKQKDTYTPGMLIFEASHACKLLFQGSHRMLEILFFSEDGSEESKLSCFKTDIWEQLEIYREKMVNKATLNHYLGLAQGQLNAQPLEIKHLYHAFRLLLEAENILDQGRPKVRLDGLQRDFLIKVRTTAGGEAEGDDQFNLSSLVAQAKAKFEELTKRTNQMTTKADKTLIDNWLVQLRRYKWGIIQS